MKKLLFGLILLILIPFTTIGQSRSSSDVYVKGYVRKNGTVVPGHYRSAPNNTNRDNFSTKGNINPYTGKKGYIKRDNKSSNYTSSQYSKKTNTVSYSGINTNLKPTYSNVSSKSNSYNKEKPFKAKDSIKYKYFYALEKRWLGLKKELTFPYFSGVGFSRNDITINIGIKTTGGGMIMAKSGSMGVRSDDHNLRGTLLFYLENGDIIKCKDRGLYDEINNHNYTFYNLTREEIHKLEIYNIDAVEFNVYYKYDRQEPGNYNKLKKYVLQYAPADSTQPKPTELTKYYIKQLFEPFWSKKAEKK
ncbi:hypothetical protein [uncultured Polaribacter sp.]|uniref:hypothetical protein n=1 Tax=uncultured Polaribacter sp. TaxID=174711 RepID=UPI00261A2BBB|nr:hypothetical protein [uncultured Polaribacter sp.]